MIANTSKIFISSTNLLQSTRMVSKTLNRLKLNMLVIKQMLWLDVVKSSCINVNWLKWLENKYICTNRWWFYYFCNWKNIGRITPNWWTYWATIILVDRWIFFFNSQTISLTVIGETGEELTLKMSKVWVRLYWLP